MIELKAVISTPQRVNGTVGGLSNTERAEILAELEKLLQESDPEWLERLNRMTIPGQLRFAQLARGNILSAIRDKGVDVPSPQPLRTIHTLIEQIEQGAPVTPATAVSFSRDGNTITEVSSLADGSTASSTINLDDAGNPVSVVSGDQTVEITYDASGNATAITVDGASCPITWEGF